MDCSDWAGDAAHRIAIAGAKGAFFNFQGAGECIRAGKSGDTRTATEAGDPLESCWPDGRRASLWYRLNGTGGPITLITSEPPRGLAWPEDRRQRG